MRKIILFLLLASLVMTACAKSTTTSQPTLSVPEPTSQITLTEAEPTKQATQASPASTSVVDIPLSSSQIGPDSGCTLVSRQPTPGPTQLSLFPAVTETDHVKGAETAKVTIIEYSDFQ